MVIVSADKDLMQLVRDDDERVVLWDSMRDRVYGPREVREKLGVPPSQVRDFLALTGDTSDNIPGVPGVGPKTASDLLAQFGSIEGIYANVEQVTKPKLRESLKAHEADARVSQKLVTLDASSPIEWDRIEAALGRRERPRAPAPVHRARVPAAARPARHAGVVRGAATATSQGRAVGRGPGVRTARGARARTGRAARRQPRLRSTRAIGPSDAVARTRSSSTRRRSSGSSRRRASAGRSGIAAAVTSDDAMRADILGVSLSIEPGRGYYVPLAHRYLGSPKQLEWSAVRAILAPAPRRPARRRRSAST